MSEVFISYARSTAQAARAAAAALRASGYSVWIDDDLPAHRAFAPEIEKALAAAKAALVLWSADATRSDWVLSEANRARADHKLVQIKLDGVRLPMPFDQIQCTDLAGWAGDTAHPGWRKAVASIAALAGKAVQVTEPSPPVAATPLTLPDKPSIAILPFANLSNDADQDYFADGMVEEIAGALARFKNLFVIGSGSSFALKGQAISAQEAARILGVRYVLDGNVRKASNRVRITATLLDASNGAQIWTNRFEDTLEDVFALQDRVALAAAGAIEPSVLVAEMARVARRPVGDLNSYDLYLRAVAAMRAQNQLGLQEGKTHLERAVELDPEFGLAWSLLSACHLGLVLLGSSGPEGAAYHIERARTARREAMRTAGDDATVLASAALQVADLDRDLKGAVDLADRAIALNPGSSIVWMYSGHVRMRTSDIDLAAEHYETAMRLDPIGDYGRRSSGYLAAPRFLQGRYEEAITLAKRRLQDQENPLGYGVLAACYARLGDRSAARRALARWRELTPRTPEEQVRASTRDPAHQQVWLDALAIIEAD